MVMKNLFKLTCFVTFISISSLNAQQVAIPDVEFEKALLNQGIDTGNLDGFISQIDAETFTGTIDLSVSSPTASPLTNLTGIEAFINITGINASPIGVEINTMNLSYNTELVYINLMSAVKMNILDFSNNTKLVDLRVSSSSPTNAFAIINLLNLNLLQRLELAYGDFVSLDISSCTALQEVYMLSSHNLSSIDFSNNTVLSTISINNCTSLTTLSNLPNSQYITVNNCNVSFLDLSTLTNLTSINLINNNLVFLNLQNGQNNNLTNVNLTGNGNLSCVLVDDASYSQGNVNWLEDSSTVYTEQGCNLVSILDAEFEKRLIALGVDTTDVLDGYILQADAEVVTGSLDLTSQVDEPMTDLTGIEAFINITGLEAYNPNDSITIMDLSLCTELELIDISDANSINHLDFTTNTKLKELYASNFDTINLSGLSFLETIEFVHANFTLFNLSTNVSLINLTINNSTNLANLNLTANTALQFIELSNIPSLTTLDLSYNPLLTNISITSNNNLSNVIFDALVNLDEIFINDNPLLTSFLDFSQTTNVLVFDLSNNNILGVNLKNGLNTGIQSFNITGNANLICVQVDDVAYSTTNWTNKDSQTFYNQQSCELVVIPDSEFEKRLISTGVDTSGILDGYILKYDAEAVAGILNTSLEIDGILTDYTGIEAFINITGFVAVNVSDRVASLDLSNSTLLEEIDIAYITDFPDFDFTANTNLKVLKINADGWQQISNLDINGLTQLEELEIIKSSFNNLDLSTNTALNKLNIEFSNNLTALDLSSHTLLNRLYVQECNNLASININNGTNTSIINFNITNNPNLICVVVDDVSYSNTNWSNKDVHTVYNEQNCDLVAIPDAEFEKRLISIGVDTSGILDGYILKYDAEAVAGILNTSLEIDGILTDYTGIEAFINITGFVAVNVSDRVASLDLSNSTLLEEIDIAYITDFPDFDFTANTNLKVLKINADGWQQISNLDINGLTQLEELEIIKSSFNNLDLSTNTALNKLNIEFSNNLTALDLSSHTLLNRLYVQECNNLALINIANGTNQSIINFNISNNSNLICVQVDDATYSNANWTNNDVHTVYSEQGCAIHVSPKVYLQGAFINPNSGEETLMRDDLRVGGLIPTTSPYADGLTCNASVFTATGSDAIVDWIWVELRDATDNTIVLASQSALLQRDGDVVGVDGSFSFSRLISQLRITTYMVINHRKSFRGYESVSNSVALSGTASAVVDLSGSSAMSSIVGGFERCCLIWAEFLLLVCWRF